MRGKPDQPAPDVPSARNDEFQLGKVELVRRSQGTLWTYSLLMVVTGLCTPYASDHPVAFAILAVPQVVLAAARALVIAHVRKTGGQWGGASWTSFYLLTLAAAATWGFFAAYPVLPYGLTSTTMVTVIFTAGLMAGGTSTLALVPRLFVPWLGVMITPLLAMAVWLRSSEGAALGAASLLCVGMLHSVGRKASAAYWEGVEKSRLLESASRAKDDFLAHMSHEIRTPLTVILGMAELLRRDATAPLDRRRLESLEAAACSLSRIVDDVLDLSRIEEGALLMQEIAFDPRGAVESAMTTMGAFARSLGTELECGVSPGVPACVIGDPGRLHQVLLNLIGNAIKFTEKGHVGVQLHVRSRTAERCRLEFAIRDTGTGIAPDRLEAIFAPFTQEDRYVERKYGGTGLGLTISSRLVSLMGGTITAESEKGVGSEFRFTADVGIAENLHGARAEAATEAGRVGVRAGAPRPLTENPLHVLAAEDDPHVSEVIAQVLTATGYRVQVVPNGRLAVEAVERGDPAFDLILMDLEMPVLNGIDAAKEIRALPDPDLRAVPIIAVTGHATQHHREQSLEAGIDVFMSKPVDFAELTETMRELMGSRSAS